jgi:outer membrane protein assembly factor BamB
MKTIITILISAALLTAADWPQFKRTPDRQGCNLAEQVTLPANLCAWVNFGSPILASPAIVAGKAYCISSRGILARIDLATNSVDWHVSLGGVNNQGCPAVGNGKVYVGCTDGNFYVLNASTGTVLATVPTGSPIMSDPLLTGNGVYFGNFGGTFYALDLDGNQKWTFDGGTRIQHAAAAYQDQIVFANGKAGLFWLRDNTTAYELVRTNQTDGTYGHGAAFTSPPMIWNGDIYVGRVELEYGIPMGLNIFDFATGADTTVGGRSKLHTCVSVDTQTQLLYIGHDYAGLDCRGSESWSTKGYWGAHPSGIYCVTSSPAVIESVVVFGSDQGKMHFYRKNGIRWPNQSGGEEIWSYVTPSNQPIQSSPAVSDGKVVFGGLDGYLYGLWNGTTVTEPVVVDSGTTIAKGRARPGAWTLTAFPNPVSGGNVTLRLGTASATATVSIYDAAGSLVRRLAVNAAPRAVMKWDLSGRTGQKVSAGTYFAVMRDRNGNKMRSFCLKVVK